jgi:hypothetical protein
VLLMVLGIALAVAVLRWLTPAVMARWRAAVAARVAG